MASDKHLARLKEGAPAWNQWRRAEPLVRPDLQGLSLTPAQKQWGETSGGPINFAQSMLRDADLRYATLIQADLGGASLIGADLSGARLRNANLRNANLSYARFDGADLADALFAGANLSGADLSGARNLSPAQIEAAEGDGKTQLPAQLAPPPTWRNGFVIEPRAHRAAEPLNAAAPASSASVLRPRKPSVSAVDRFGRALRGLPRPRLDGVASQARRALGELPRPSPQAAADRAKRALQRLPRPTLAPLKERVRRSLDKLPRPSLAAMRERAQRGLAKLPRPRLSAVTDRARTALGRLPMPTLAPVSGRLRQISRGLTQPKFVAIAGIVAFIVIGLSGLVALRAVHKPASRIAADTPAAQQTAEAPQAADPVPVVAAPREPTKTPPQNAAQKREPAKEEPPQRVQITDAGATTAVEDEAGAAAVATAAKIEESPHTTAAVTAVGVVEVRAADERKVAVQELPVKAADHPADPLVRLAFANRAEDVAGAGQKPAGTLDVGSAASVVAESYAGQPVEAHNVQDAMPRTDLPKPTTLAKAQVPELPLKAPPAPRAPTTLLEYLSTPTRSSDWIKVFVKDFYLSEDALEERDLRRIYSKRVDYFGKHKTSLDEVAREKADYYQTWPERHYELVPGSIAIDWKSADVADVSFTYTYKVSAPGKKTASGRGRAHLTLDLRGPTGHIVREDGEVLAHN